MAKQRKPLEKQPTAKQIRAARLISENIGNTDPKTLKQILKEAGYSKAVAKNPQLVTESEGFRMLMDRAGLTDDALLKTLGEGLQAEDKDGRKDHNIRHKYLETGLRLKGLGRNDPANVNLTFIAQSGQQRQVYDV